MTECLSLFTLFLSLVLMTQSFFFVTKDMCVCVCVCVCVHIYIYVHTHIYTLKFYFLTEVLCKFLFWIELFLKTLIFLKKEQNSKNMLYI